VAGEQRITDAEIALKWCKVDAIVCHENLVPPADSRPVVNV